MPKENDSKLRCELEDLRQRLDEAEQVVRGIQDGEVDALVVSGQGGQKVYTLEGADQPYRITVEAMSEGALTLTDDGSVLYCNTCFTTMVKAQFEKIAGQPFEQFIAPADKQQLAKLLRGSRKRKCSGELRLHSADGREVPVQLSLVPLDLAGGRATCVVVTDLTEVIGARDARLRLAAIVESSSDAIVGVTPDGTILSWNAAAERMFGYTAAEAIGRLIGTLFPGDHPAEHAAIEHAIGLGDNHHCLDTVRTRRDGKKIDVNISISPINDAAGRTIGASCTYQDISDRKRAEESLHQLSGLLLRLQDEERRRVSRDLQDSMSPLLTSLIGKLYALKKRGADLDSVSMRLLEESLTLAEHASTVTGDVSSLLHPPMLESHGLAASLRWFLESYSKRSGARVETNLPALLPLPNGAAIALFRIVQDSLMRVLRHSASGVVSVQISNGRQGLTLEITEDEPHRTHDIPNIQEDEFTIPVMRHRMEQLGGVLDITSAGAKTVITARLPRDSRQAIQIPRELQRATP